MPITCGGITTMKVCLGRASKTLGRFIPPRIHPRRPSVKLDPSAFVADAELIQALEEQSSSILCGCDRILFRQGDVPTGLYILSRGEVTLTMSAPNGDELMSIQAIPGSLLGLPGLIGNEPYTLAAIARKDAELHFVSRDEFTNF